MNLAYSLIILNGLDNLTTYTMLNWHRAQEINPAQKYLIEVLGLAQSQVMEFFLFILFIIPLSYFLYKRSRIGYYVLTGLLLAGFAVTLMNNVLLLSLSL